MPVGFLPSIAEHLGTNTVGNGALDGIWIQEARQCWRGKEGISHCPGGPHGHGGRPETHEAIRAYARRNLIVPDEGMDDQLRERRRHTGGHMPQVKLFESVVLREEEDVPI